MGPVKAYLLGIVTAAALATGTITLDSLSAQTIFPVTKSIHADKCVDGVVLSSIRDIIKNQLCADASKNLCLKIAQKTSQDLSLCDEQHNTIFDIDNCLSENVKVASINWNETQTCASARFDWDFNTSIGEIQ